MAVYHSPMTLVQALGFSIAGAATYYYSRLTHEASKDTAIGAEKKYDTLRKIDEELQLID